MNYLFMYCITVLIWGSTWIAIHFQLGTVSPLWSIVYRFALSACLLGIYCLLTKRSLKFNASQHAAIALQGLLLFSLNYILYYFSAMYLNSGVLAVIFATIILMNIFNSRIFFKTPFDLTLCVAAIIGLLGLAQIFWSELHKILWQGGNLKNFIIGIVMAVAATYLASLGNMASASTLRLHRLPVIESNTLGMAYGTVYTAFIAFFFGGPPTFDFAWAYCIPLIYLSLFGSVIAFGTYLSLLNRIGPERVAYVFVLTPIVALLLSTFFENFHWSIGTFTGLLFVLFGNILVLNRKYLAFKDSNTLQEVSKEVTET
jgi:drug/metabolite transporter (DMT)-like permease